MSGTTFFAFLLTCLTVSAYGYNLHLFDSSCPSDAAEKLDHCLTSLERISELGFLSRNCGPAIEAYRCSRVLLRACMTSGDAGILKVLANHDLSLGSKLLSLCQEE